MAVRKANFIIDREFEVNTTLRDIFFADLGLQHKFIDKSTKTPSKTTTTDTEMAPVNCFKFSYLGTTRYVICDLDTRYEQIQNLVARTFRLPDECIPAIKFTDGKSYHFSKELFEYFILLFPQPEQKFYVRLELNKIIENRIANKEAKHASLTLAKDINKRTHEHMLDAAGERVAAAPLRRSNCFLGTLPSNDGTKIEDESSDAQQQPRKRMRLMKSIKKTNRNMLKMPQTKRALRL